LLVCVTSASPALAGAWVPQTSQQQVISTLSLADTSDSGSQPSLELYAEQGLGHGVALVSVATMRAQDDHPAGGERLTALRVALPAPEGWALSAQFGLVEGPRLDAMGDFVALEQRIAVGHGWSWGTWFDASYAIRDCDGATSTRWDAAIGHRFGNGDQVIAKSFGENSVCGIARDRVQISYVRQLRPGVGVELGWRETLSSHDGWGSRGVVASLWRSF
jgi:hypothetical protein